MNRRKSSLGSEKLNLWDFDEGWKFHPGDIRMPESAAPIAVKAGFATGGAEPDAPDADWHSVRLPHDWGIENKPVQTALPQQGSYPRGVGWYRKSFRLPENSEGKKVFLEFEGISRESSVWVNGFFMGSHSSGYTPFLCDITDVVPRWRFQESADPVDDGRLDVVAVRVDARAVEGWWYEGCGIYRHAHLHVLDHLHFDLHGAWCETLDASEAEASVRFHATVVNEYEEPRDAVLRLAILSRDGGEAATAVSPEMRLTPGFSAIELDAIIRRPNPWSPDNPYLYRAQARLDCGGVLADCRDIPLGVRWFDFDSARGFFLNGRPLKLRGVNCHQDFAGVGVALPDRLHEKRVELLKEMGANAFRCAHNPPAPAFLDACDGLGLLVIDENRKLDVSPEGRRDLDLMVRRDRHHPCVFAWSLCNEEFAATRPLAAKALRTLACAVRREDRTRPVMFAGNNFAPDSGTQGACWRAVDAVGRNYGWRAYDREHALFPEFKCMSTEFGALRETRCSYLDEAGRREVATPLEFPLLQESEMAAGIQGPSDAAGNILAATLADLVCHWRAIAEREFMAGGFLWSGMDYRGETTWPRIHSEFGAMDLCGFPKDSYYYFKACWRPAEPLVHVFPHWTWLGREGRSVYLRVVGNCDEVDLLVNGESLGRKPMPSPGLLEWRTIYRPGNVTAVGYRDGNEVCRDAVRTAGAPARLLLSADTSLLAPDGQDVACVTASLLDENGVLVPNDDRLVHFKIEGACLYLGGGNGDPCDHTPDSSEERRTFRGLCLAIVESRKEAGAGVLRAVAKGLPDVSIQLTIKGDE